MEFIPVKCPSCGGDLMLPKANDQAICNYCGSCFLLKEAASKMPMPSVENWFRLAENALNSGNLKEAYEYYNRILEVDSKNAAAWLGKGKSAGWLSTLGNPRFQEMGICFAKANEFAIKNISWNETINEMVSSAGDLFTAYSKSSIDYRFNYVKSEDTWNKFVAQSRELLYGVDYLLNIDPKNEMILKIGVETTTGLIDGWFYIDNYSAGRHPKLSEGEIQELIIKKETYLKIVKEANPYYQDPQYYLYKPENETEDKLEDPQKKKPDCFIATATMGDYDHPYVISLRLFRDRTLLTNPYGTKFVKFYYHTSPFFANIISRSKILRQISLWLLIKPFSIIASWINH